ncbi:Protein of unknown function [Bacillus mycoides]|nr:Protein of unknown function [Bacillus mycoides]
MRSGGAAKY